jgi:hypothetical protein
MNKKTTEEWDSAFDAFNRLLNKLGIAIAKAANESQLGDDMVRVCVEMVYGDMLVQMTGDPTMKQKWLEHCETFQSRHFTH